MPRCATLPGRRQVSGIAFVAPYLDTDADQLSYTLGLPAREALAVSDVTVGGLTVQLRLPGASPQVFAGPGETVACLPGMERGLPATATQELADWNYRFSARVQHLSTDESTEQVALLRSRVDGRPEARCGVFPGSSEAVTALAVEQQSTGLGWRISPHSCQIVAAHTWLEAR